MKPATYFLAALAAASSAVAVDQTKSAIVWFDDPSTPDSIVNQAKETIVKAGGKITHIYSLIKGFSVIAPETALTTMQAWGTEHSMKVEEDEVVSINHGN